MVLAFPLSLPAVFFQPAGKFVLGQIPAGEVKKRGGGSFFSCGKLPTVQFEKGDAGDERDALVAIDEWMIFRDTESIGGCEIESGGFAIGGKISRASKRGLQQAMIAHARRATVLGDQFSMVSSGVDGIDPDPAFHFASSRSALRYRRMTRRAADIFFSNPGS